jgi:hypothetical protein
MLSKAVQAPRKLKRLLRRPVVPGTARLAATLTSKSFCLHLVIQQSRPCRAPKSQSFASDLLICTAQPATALTAPYKDSQILSFTPAQSWYLAGLVTEQRDLWGRPLLPPLSNSFQQRNRAPQKCRGRSSYRQSSRLCSSSRSGPVILLFKP